jgi:hypothetical protein
MTELPKQIELMYEDTLENIMFVKKQQWAVTGYALAAEAALYLVAKEVPEYWVKIVFVAFAVSGGIYALVMLTDLSGGLQKFRDRLDWLYQNLFTQDEVRGLKLGFAYPTRKEWVLDGLYGVVIVATVVTSLGILFAKPPTPSIPVSVSTGK